MSEEPAATTDDVISFFERHLVPIFVRFKKEDLVETAIYSAFVIDVGGYWWLLTAGHCINEIQSKHEISDETIVRLCDGLRTDSVHKMPVPLGYDPDLTFAIDEEYGADYGLIQLDENHRQLLEANGVVALDERCWRQQPEGVEFYRMIGIPKDLTRFEGDSAHVGISMHRVEPLPERPRAFGQGKVERFYGRVSMGGPLNSLKGLSGAPILAFKTTDKGQLRYWLHSIQSSWNRSTNEIAACYVHPFAMMIEDVIKEIQGRWESS